MKKALPFLMAVALLAGCSQSAAPTEEATETDKPAEETAETEKEEVQTVGEYTLYNATGEGITELYLHEADSEDKGDNLIGDHGFKDAHAMMVTFDAGDKAADTTLCLDFITESGYEGKFETLHIETAPITLLAEDAVTGATQISFTATKATYTIYNVTGEKVTDLYMYPTDGSDKGENLIDGAAEDGGSQEIVLDEVPAELIKDNVVGSFTLEFTTESGYTGKFTTLSYENAPIQLIAEDAKTGATEIKFGNPQ